MKKLFLFALLPAACNQNKEIKLEKSDRDYRLMSMLLNPSGQTPQKADTSGNKRSVIYYCSQPGTDGKAREKKLLGKIIPDLGDSTLLTFVYGSCRKKEGHFEYNNGVQMWDDRDSVYMRVEERIDADSSVSLVYLRGEMAITCRMHNFFNETALLCKRVGEMWKITDAYVDQTSIDYHSVELAGIFDGRMLLRYETSGIYAGGVGFGSAQYTWLKNDSLSGSSVSFITGSGNTASEQCMPEVMGQCDCYERSGEVKFRFNEKWNCLVFDYAFETTDSDCKLKHSRTRKTTQRWYMSADTSFIAGGHELSEWGENILGKVSLKPDQIKKMLKVKG
jgi:hypothetical protein